MPSPDRSSRTAASILRSPEAWYFTSKVVPGAFGLLAVLLLVRILGEAQYGVYSLYFAAAVFSSNLLSGWIKQALLRSSGRQREADLPRTIRLGTALGSAPLVAAIGIGAGVSGDALTAMAAGCLLAVALSHQSVVLGDVQSASLPKEYARLEAIRAAIGTILGIALCVILPSAWVVLMALAAAAAVASRPRAAARAKHHRPLTTDQVREWWAFGWPMALWMSASTALQFFDRFVVAHISGIDAAGYYSALNDLVTRGTAMIIFPFILASHPKIMAAFNNSGERAAAVECRVAARRLTAASVAVIVVGAALSPFATAVAGLAPQRNDALSTFLLLLGSVLWQVALLVHKPLEIARRTKAMMGRLVVTVLVTLGLTVPLVALLGPLGAAVTSATGPALYLLLCVPRWRAFLKGSDHEEHPRDLRELPQ